MSKMSKDKPYEIPVEILKPKPSNGKPKPK